MSESTSDASAFVRGAEFVLNQFDWAPHMNGCVVACVAWVPDINRVIVRIRGGLELAVLPRHLRPANFPNGTLLKKSKNLT